MIKLHFQDANLIICQHYTKAVFAVLGQTRSLMSQFRPSLSQLCPNLELLVTVSSISVPIAFVQFQIHVCMSYQNV